MSQTRPMNYYRANVLSRRLVELLRPGCERIAVAGSLRRHKGENGGPGPSDIEVVCMPSLSFQTSILGVAKRADINSLDSLCEELRLQGVLEKRRTTGGATAWGTRLKRAVFCHNGSVAACDIFSVLSPAQWGVIPSGT